MKKVFVQCPGCGHEFPVSASVFASQMGAITTPRKAAAARRNGRKGGQKARVSPPLSFEEIDAALRRRA